MSKETFTLKVFRGTSAKQYWEEFELERSEGLNIISVLMKIQKEPINAVGQRVAPVTWEQGCLEEVCGSCTMLVNGRPRQSCSTLIENLIEETGSNTITIAPISSYPLLRDLCVDRSRMFEQLKKVKAWAPVDDSLSKGAGPKVSPDKQEKMYTLSTCMTCGCCTEACPQVNGNSEFIGPAAISQARLFNMNPASSQLRKERLRTLMKEGGIGECGNAQNCVQVCPKGIPLTESIAVAGRDVTAQAAKDLFSVEDFDD